MFELDNPPLKDQVDHAFHATGPDALKALLYVMAERIEAAEAQLAKLQPLTE